MSRTTPRPFSLALEGLTATIAPATPLARIQGVWAQAVGPAVADAARPTSERGGTLTVTCEASVWAQELTMIGEELIRSLNEALGEDLVSELRCRTG